MKYVKSVPFYDKRRLHLANSDMFSQHVELSSGCRCTSTKSGENYQQPAIIIRRNSNKNLIYVWFVLYNSSA